MTHRFIILFSIALLLGGLVSARAADDKGELFGTVTVPAKISSSEVQSTIAMVIASRGWELKAKEDGLIVGYLKHRSNEATVTLTYDATTISIFCVGYEINKRTGERKNPELPKGWLNYIKGDLIKKLNQLAATK
jgi:hypothetical protein